MNRRPETARRPIATLPPAQQAGILCNDAAFQTFAATRSGFAGGQFTAGATAEFLRMTCGVTSRATLNTNPDAAARFAAMQTDFDSWRGRIAPQHR